MNMSSFLSPLFPVSKTNIFLRVGDHHRHEVQLSWTAGVVLLEKLLKNYFKEGYNFTPEIERKILQCAYNGVEFDKQLIIENFKALFDRHPSGIPIHVNFANEHAISHNDVTDSLQTHTVYVTEVRSDPTDERVFVTSTLFELLSCTMSEDVVFIPWSDSPPTTTHEAAMSKRSTIDNCCLCLEGDILYFGLLQRNAGQSGYDARLGMFVNTDSSLLTMNVLESLRAVGSFPAKSENTVAKLLRAYIAGVMRRTEMNELGAYDVVMPIEDKEHNKQHAFLPSLVL